MPVLPQTGPLWPGLERRPQARWNAPKPVYKDWPWTTYVPLNNLLQGSPGRFQGRLEVFENLLDLGRQVAFTYPVSGAKRVLSAYIDRFDVPGDNYHICKGRFLFKPPGLRF